MNDLLNPGGYGFYLWMSFGMGIVLIALEILLCRRRHKKAIVDARRSQTRVKTDDSAR